MRYLMFIAGLLAIGLAWLLLYRASSVYRLNQWMRDYVFNDEWVLFSGGKVAVVLLLIGGGALFFGMRQVTDDQTIKPNIAEEIITESRLDMVRGHFTRAITRCEGVLHSDPNNIDAWEVIAMSWWMAGDKDRARAALQNVVRIKPDYFTKKTPLARIYAKPEKNNKSADVAPQ